MRLVLLHVDDPPYADPSVYEEEASIIIPGGARTALLVPFAVLDEVLPLLLEALDELPEQRCDACGEPLAVPPDLVAS